MNELPLIALCSVIVDLYLPATITKRQRGPRWLVHGEQGERHRRTAPAA